MRRAALIALLALTPCAGAARAETTPVAVASPPDGTAAGTASSRLDRTRALAAGGSIEAQALLAATHFAAEDRPGPDYDAVSPAEALHWARVSADRGHRDMQSALGMAYLFGRKVARNYKLARHYLATAADAGDSWAQFYFGSMLANGQGGPRDLEGGYVYASIAAIHLAEARDWVARLEDMLTRDQIARAQARAVTWHTADGHDYRPPKGR